MKPTCKGVDTLGSDKKTKVGPKDSLGGVRRKLLRSSVFGRQNFKQMKLTKFLLFLIPISLACGSERTNESLSTDLRVEIEVGKPSPKTESLWNLLGDTAFVKLETTEKSILERISKVMTIGDKYYVFDDARQNLMIFNSQGSYLKTIGKRGNGPGEYIDLFDFTISSDKSEVILLSVEKRSILYFDTDGNYIREKRLPYQSWSIASLGNNSLAHYLCYYDPSHQNLHINDKDGNNVEMFEFPKGQSPMNILSISGGITENNEGLLYTDQASNIIHQVKHDFDHFPKYEIKFKNDFWPESSRFDSKGFFEKASGGLINFLTCYYHENQKGLVFSYCEKRGSPRDPMVNIKNAFYRFSDKMLFDYRNINEHELLSLISPPLGITEDGVFISGINPSNYLQSVGHAPEYLREGLSKALSGCNVNDNPYLFLYDFQ